MIVGVLKEIKAEENRVSMTSAAVEMMKQRGHTVLVEKGAGTASGFEDATFDKAGASIIETPQEIYERANATGNIRAG
jgi:alanine dehydrogenase